MDIPKTFRVIGVRRSGNHAIINWLLANINNGCNVDIFFDNKLKSKVYTDKNKKIFFFNDCYTSPFWSIKNLKQKIMLHSYEDKQYGYIKRFSYNKLLDSEDRVVNIIIVRDIYNITASRIKRGFPRVNNFFVNTWISHMDEVMGKTNHFKNKIVIVYNRWLVDKEYRDEISKKIGVTNYDVLDKVAISGNGSSFVGLKLDKTTNYLERYKQVEFNDKILDMLNKDRVVNIVKKEFPKIYDDIQILTKKF